MSFFIAIVICIIVSIPFFWTFISKFCSLKEKSFCLFFKNIFLDESSLHKQPLFWLLIILPVIFSVALWAIISPEYKLEWTAHGYAGLIKYGQLPLMILALSPILGAFVISAHRSLQTFTQINATNEQIKTGLEQLKEAKNKNKNDMYFNIRKHVYEQLSYIKTKNNEEINKPTSLYIKAFETKNYEDIINWGFPNELNKLILNFKEIGAVFRKIFNPNSLIVNQQSLIASCQQQVMFLDFDEIIEYINDFKSFLFFSVDDIKSNQNEKFKSELIRLNVEFYKLPIDDFDRELLEHDIKNKYYDYLNFLLHTIEDLLDISSEIMVVLYPNENLDDLLPDFPYMESDYYQLQQELSDLFSNNIGDKLAAENQNPPE
ncbi:hypothetical protein OKT76_09015 [Providencia rettgeri]|uniref:hypothetical protein n=1 Tax=Providencia rettgeri TaxID=587 RepID=UPI00226FA92B|nr:hypothetical protein [Providencia rettgeri]MCX9095867.1 hypothetical protein [Providencia rettgeri]